MINMKNNTKQIIVEAALQLFHTNGYDGTSIRDIALKAEINPANIAYYFKNKNGLLEYCFTNYLEKYIEIFEIEIRKLEPVRADVCLFAILSSLLDFQAKHFIAARFIIRELTLDTRLNREILSTYMAKERYYFQYLIETGIKNSVFRQVNIPTFIVQIKGLLTGLVIHAHYAAELLHMQPRDNYYIEQYKNQCLLFVSQNLLTSQAVVSL